MNSLTGSLLKANMPGGLPAAIQIAMMMGGFRLSRAVHVVAALGVVDLLRDGPMTCDQLALLCDAHSPSLYRVMRSLTSFGIFLEDELGRFALTALASMLLSDTPDTVLPVALTLGDESHWSLWGELFYCVETGEPAWDHLFGMDFITSCEKDSDLERKVNASKIGIYSPSDHAILAAYDFSQYQSIIEVGLGSGCGGLLAKIIGQYKALTGVLYDLPFVISEAKARIRFLGLDDRCQLVAGDCRQTISVHGDLFLLRGVLHNLTEDVAVSVLKTCRTAMNEGGKLLLCEMIMPSGNDFFVGKFIDLESLLLISGARERSVEEFHSLIEAAGLRVSDIIGTAAPISIIEVVKN